MKYIAYTKTGMTFRRGGATLTPHKSIVELTDEQFALLSKEPIVTIEEIKEAKKAIEDVEVKKESKTTKKKLFSK